jgi:hypothetical protein
MSVNRLHPHSGANTLSVLACYTDQLVTCREKLQKVQKSRLQALIAATCFALMAVVFGGLFSFFRVKSCAVFAVMSGCAAFHFIARYKRAGNEWTSLDGQCDYFEGGIKRLTDAWQGLGDPGLDHARVHHLYETDLNILGTGSLFELLCTTRSQAGASRLASYLLDPVAPEETQRRQQCVRELRDVQNLREQLHHFGRNRFQDCSESAFDDWFRSPPLHLPRTLPFVMLASSVTSLSLGIAIYAGAIGWAQWAPMLLLLLITQLSLGILCYRAVHPRLQTLLHLSGEFSVLRQGLGFMERQHFYSAKLKELVETLRSQHASATVRKVERIFRLLEKREKPEFYLVAIFLVVGTQAVIAIEAWRSRYQDAFKSWMHAWAEFEALVALGGYAYERPGNTFPEFIEGPPLFHAQQLGHPLLAVDTCITNDIALGGERSLYLISGSNMAGKSTLLRAIGLNAVLGRAGAPVCAASARFSSLTICASLSLSDSLLEGKSKFLAEVGRISQILMCARSGEPVLFLIDEILSGTNSQDRRVSVAVIIEALLANGAIGALSTHDLALTEIANNPALAVLLVHMASQNPDKPLDFDYRLHPGVVRHSNALAIVRMLGITASDAADY